MNTRCTPPRIARTLHECDACREPIHPGERYVTMHGHPVSSRDRIELHAHCCDPRDVGDAWWCRWEPKEVSDD